MNRLISPMRSVACLMVTLSLAASGLQAGTTSVAGTYQTADWLWYAPANYWLNTVNYSASIGDDVSAGPVASSTNCGWTAHPLNGAIAGGEFGLSSLYYPGVGGNWATFTGAITLDAKRVPDPWTPAIDIRFIFPFLRGRELV